MPERIYTKIDSFIINICYIKQLLKFFTIYSFFLVIAEYIIINSIEIFMDITRVLSQVSMLLSIAETMYKCTQPQYSR
ncbi:MAG: hypothetical protein PG981_000699 [Wolbachia endosymbiont of Ctenocephalides orientis wCori]|nr:MAG: hypothetical protein PG981_000699 [Wolbachia endosymbiont of Ctenocephalides orientis wCori]